MAKNTKTFKGLSGKHSEDKKQVTFWIERDLVEKWDEWGQKHGLTRTSMFKNAMLFYMREFSDQPSKEIEIEALKAELSEQIAMLGEKIEKKEVSASNSKLIYDQDINKRITNVLKIGAAHFDDIANAAGVDEDLVIDILKKREKAGMVELDVKTGKWRGIEKQ